jgi:hypothetical protein
MKTIDGMLLPRCENLSRFWLQSLAEKSLVIGGMREGIASCVQPQNTFESLAPELTLSPLNPAFPETSERIREGSWRCGRHNVPA